MYSRYGDSSKRPVRLPEHYGGSAFSPSQQLPTNPIPVPKREPIKSFPKDGVGEKVSPVADRLLRAEALQEPDVASQATRPPSSLEDLSVASVSEITEESAEECEEACASQSDKKAASPLVHFEGLRHLFAGKSNDDHDRLLLLGLILLLSRSEGDSDILLWLSLLLLCG